MQKSADETQPANILLAQPSVKMFPLYGYMIETQSEVIKPAVKREPILRRIITFLIVAMCVGFLMRHMSKSMAQSTEPAGFLRGTLQGALMPCALPNLLVGNDVTIYAPNNTGRTYKLGYTFGVNACGAIFFGLFFWRVSRWRKDKDGT